MTPLTPTSDSPEEDRAPTHIVGLGASAGGLQPLQEFLSHVPVPSGVAYVVVQHMDPTHKAMLPDLLQRTTSMPVREVTASMRVVSKTRIKACRRPQGPTGTLT